MKSVLIVTGNPQTHGTGHLMRMRTVALELRKKKLRCSTSQQRQTPNYTCHSLFQW